MRLVARWGRVRDVHSWESVAIFPRSELVIVNRVSTPIAIGPTCGPRLVLRLPRIAGRESDPAWGYPQSGFQVYPQSRFHPQRERAGLTRRPHVSGQP